MSQTMAETEFGGEQREAKEYGTGPMRTRPFAHVTSVGDSMPTATERKIARRLLDHRRIEKVSWRTYGKKIHVRPVSGVDLDRILLDDVKEMVAEVGGERYDVWEEGEAGQTAFVQNRNRA